MRCIGLARALPASSLVHSTKQITSDPSSAGSCLHVRRRRVGSGSAYLRTPVSWCRSEGESHPVLPCTQLSCDPQGILSPSPGPPVQPVICSHPVPVCPHGLCAQGPCKDTLWAWVLLWSPSKGCSPPGLCPCGCAGAGGAALRLVKGATPVLGGGCTGAALGPWWGTALG